MAYIRIVNEDEATGRLAEDYAFLSGSYSKAFGGGAVMATPQVYRTSSVVEPYFHFGALQNRVQTADGEHPPPEGPLPLILVNYGVAINSACFY